MSLNSALTRFFEWYNSPMPSGSAKVIALIMLLTFLGNTIFYIITWIQRTNIIKYGVYTKAEIIGASDLRAFKFWWLGRTGDRHFYRYKADVCFALITGEMIYTKCFVVNPQHNSGKPEIPIVYSPKKPKKVILPNDTKGKTRLICNTIWLTALTIWMAYVYFTI